MYRMKILRLPKLSLCIKICSRFRYFFKIFSQKRKVLGLNETKH